MKDRIRPIVKASVDSLDFIESGQSSSGNGVR